MQFNRFARILQNAMQKTDAGKRKTLEFWRATLHLNCAKMMIQTRKCMELNNLVLNVETNKYEFLFDAEELEQYGFADSAYLGKEKICMIKESNEIVSGDKAKEIANNVRIKNEYTHNTSNDIISLLKQVIQIGTVNAYLSIESKKQTGAGHAAAKGTQTRREVGRVHRTEAETSEAATQGGVEQVGGPRIGRRAKHARRG